ncbi:major capsid protein [Microvirga solisilvae]|uniref:major capsid protein n=1 Tax=Microvirga solisilvae TaxID=2919498 RepID=UPI001FAE88DB|nr:major capsid protein [Microvirga solisilvae]
MSTVLNLFDNDAFSVVELNEEVVRKVDHKPQLLGSLNLFQPIYSRSRTIGIAKKEGTLSLIPTSELGAAPEELIPEGADLRDFRVKRLAKGSSIYAYELQGVAALPGEEQLKEVQTEVADRVGAITDDMELTWEHMRLGAVLGTVYDADGTSVINNWFSEWGISPPAEVNFALGTEATDVRKKCRDIKRAMKKAAKGVWTPGTKVGALCGDSFFDALVNHKQIKETKLGTERAASLENIDGYSSVEIEGIVFINYQGTDDGTTLAIESTKCKFFPIGARGAFQVGWAPAEFFPYVNQRGEPLYGLVLPDPSGRDAFRRVELYSYPLFICTRPEMLLSARES